MADYTHPFTPTKLECHPGEWTVHDGRDVVRDSLEFASARTPESRRLVHETQRACFRKPLGRSSPDEAETQPASDKAENGRLSNGISFTVASVHRLVRNFWLLDGMPSTPVRDGRHATHSNSPPKKPALTPPATMPRSVMLALWRHQLHVLKGWLGLCPSNIHSTDPNGSTALHYSVMHPFPAAIDLLIARGADVNACVPTNGSTALLITTLRRPYDLATIERLLRGGADVDIPDHDGHTPLMVASRAGWPDTVRMLVEAGASLDARDKDEHTALWYACKYEQKAVTMLLRNARSARR